MGEAVGVRGVLGDGGQGEGGEALVSVVLGAAVRLEAGSARLDLVDGPGAWHDEAGGPVRLTTDQCTPGTTTLSYRAAGVGLSGRSDELVPLVSEVVDGLGVGEDQRGGPVGLEQVGG